MAWKRLTRRRGRRPSELAESAVILLLYGETTPRGLSAFLIHRSPVRIGAGVPIASRLYARTVLILSARPSGSLLRTNRGGRATSPRPRRSTKTPLVSAG